MPVRIEPNTEPIAGYRLIERLGGGGFGEVWKCEAPGGIFKAPLDASGAAGMLFVGGQVDPHFLAVTADNVYWTTWGPRPAVHRLAK